MAADRYNTVIRMRHPLAERVKAYAERRGISMNDALCLMLDERLDQIDIELKERELILQRS